MTSLKPRLKIAPGAWPGCLGLLWLLTLLPAPLEARSIRWWLPEELYAKADLVALVMPIEITNTGETSDIQLNPNAPVLPGQVKRAMLEVQYVVKGVAGEGLEMQYVALDPERAVADAPVRIEMEPLGTYVVYLKRNPNENFYRGALDGDFDDGQAVIEIAPSPRSSADRDSSAASPVGSPQDQASDGSARQSAAQEAGMTTRNKPAILSNEPRGNSRAEGRAQAGAETGTSSPNRPATTPQRPRVDQSRGALPAPAFPEGYDPREKPSGNPEEPVGRSQPGQPVVGRPVGDSDALQVAPDPEN